MRYWFIDAILKAQSDMDAEIYFTVVLIVDNLSDTSLLYLSNFGLLEYCWPKYAKLLFEQIALANRLMGFSLLISTKS